MPYYRVSYNEIIPRLYLGNLFSASRKQIITKLGITHLVTVEIKPVNGKMLAKCVKYVLFISAMDHEGQDLISHFGAVNQFIRDALADSSNKVFVHCVAGVSRSATLVMAYLMRTRRISFRSACQLVASQRRVVNPNEGFIDQLKLYQRMKFNMDITNRDYRLIALECLIFEFSMAHLTKHKPVVWLAQRPKSSENLQINTILYNNTLKHLMIGHGSVLIKTLVDQYIHASSHAVALPARHSEAQLSSSGVSFNNNDNSVVATTTSSRARQNKLEDVACADFCLELYFGKLQLRDTSSNPRTYKKSTGYLCANCKTMLFYYVSILKPPRSIELYEISSNDDNDDDHHHHHHRLRVTVATSGSKSSSSVASSSKSSGAKSDKQAQQLGPLFSGRKCQYLFVEPQPWMKRQLLEIEKSGERAGDINCDKCNTKLGDFDWTCNLLRCNCLRHSSLRGVSFIRIDERQVVAKSRTLLASKAD